MCVCVCVCVKDVGEAYAGDICAMFGVDCNSGDTFVSKDEKYMLWDRLLLA